MTDSLFDLEGRVALVTGGNSGIGRSLAHALIGLTRVNAVELASAFEQFVKRRTPSGRWGETRDLVGGYLASDGLERA